MGFMGLGISAHIHYSVPFWDIQFSSVQDSRHRYETGYVADQD